MIRFFRQIRQRLITQNRFSKYLLYAVGEILLVVIGILIALQIDNWNEWRKDRTTEISMLRELKDNLERNTALIDYAAAEIDKINQTTGTILKIVDEHDAYPDTLVTSFSQLGRSGSFLLHINTNGYESLKNTGFEILTSIDLKKEILTLFEVTYPGYRQEVEVVNAIWGNDPFWWQEYFYIPLRQTGWTPLDFNALKEDKKFLSIVQDLVQGRIRILDQMLHCKAETQRVLVLIEKELADRDEKN